MKIILRRIVQLSVILLIFGIGQHFVLKAESSQVNQFNYSHVGKFNLAKIGLKTHAKSSVTVDFSKEKTIFEENDEEEFESEISKKSEVISKAFLVAYLPESLFHNYKTKVAFANRIDYFLPVESTILYQVFRI